MGTKREGEKKRDRQGGRGGGWEESEKREPGAKRSNIKNEILRLRL